MPGSVTEDNSTGDDEMLDMEDELVVVEWIF